MTASTALPLTISEAAFQRTVTDLAYRAGWRVCHIPTVPVLRGRAVRHVTAYTGHSGLPDLILARHGVVLLVELKRQHGRLTPEQRLWLAALGGHGHCWRPSDWPAIVATLTGKASNGAVA